MLPINEKIHTICILKSTILFIKSADSIQQHTLSLRAQPNCVTLMWRHNGPKDHNGEPKVISLFRHFMTLSEATMTEFLVICNSLQKGTYRIYSDMDMTHSHVRDDNAENKGLHLCHDAFTFWSHLDHCVISDTRKLFNVSIKNSQLWSHTIIIKKAIPKTK